MTFKPTLMLLAAALAPLPLYAQQPEAPAAAPAQQAPSAASVRSEALGMLGALPADVEAAAVFNHLSSLHPGGCCPVESISIGLSKGSAASLQSLLNMAHAGFSDEARRALVEALFENAREELEQAIQAGLPDEPDKEQFQTAASNVKIHPIYIAASAAPGQEEQFNKALDSFISQLRSKAESDEGITFEEKYGDIYMTIKGTSLGYKPGSDWQSAILKDELKNRTLHYGILRNKDSFIAVLSEDPEEPVLVQKPEQSVLDTQTWASVDAHLAEDIIFAMHVSPELINARRTAITGVESTLAPVAVVFSNLAKAAEGTPDEQVYTAAAEGVKQLLSNLDALVPEVKEPHFVQVWKTADGVHADISCDAMGISYKPAKLKHTAKAEDPQTIYYAEMTPISINGAATSIDWANTVVPVFNGIQATLPESDREQMKEDMASAMPLLDKVCSSLRPLGEGLGGGTVSLVIDNRSTAPIWVMDRDGVILPRVAFHSGVSDRAKLSQAWDGILDLGRTVLEETGEDPAMIDMLPIVPTPVGDATSYTVALPIFTPNLCPNVTVSDTAFAIGSSSKLNQELVSATGTQDFAGAVFSLRFAPLADMVATWTVEGEDDDVARAAAALKAAASILETVSGSSTIKDGVHTLHIDFKLKK